MSAAAGAPPPPPPPQPRKSINDLPAELFLEIIRFLHINEYIQFVLALYPTLQYHGLVPTLTPDLFHRITRPLPPEHLDSSHESSSDSPWRGDYMPLPIELNDQIMTYLEPTDRIAWLFSDRRMFWRYFPSLTDATRRRLWNAAFRSKKK